MKILVILGVVLCLDISQAFAQTKAAVSQEAGRCSVNITGNGNNASLVCKDVDRKLAEQVKAILNGTQRNEKAINDISQKLNVILKDIDRQRPQPRRIPPDKRAEIVAILRGSPAKIRVLAIQHNAEAYQFAQDWYDSFKAAGWTMMDDMVRVFEFVGRPEPGIQFKFRGATIPPGRPFNIPRDSPAGVLSDSLERLKVTQQVRGQRYPDIPEDEVSFWVHEQPEN